MANLMEGFAVLRWNDDRDLILTRLAKQRSVLKIILKTKNDPILLESWIRHHLAIVGPRNLIIFDNMSTDPHVIEIYGKYSDDVEVISFAGMHNNIHYPEKFPELYQSLSETCRYFAFLDTDELLILIDGDIYLKDNRIIDALSETRAGNVFPATWLCNVDWDPSKFACGPERLSDGLAWGKPILGSGIKASGSLCHNIEINPKVYDPTVELKFFVLHLTELSPKQRIATNINKLVARRFANEGESAEEIVAKDLSGVKDDNIIQYVSQIKRHLLAKDVPINFNSQLRPGCLRTNDDGSISFYSEREQKFVSDFVSNPLKSCEKSFGFRFGIDAGRVL